MDERVIMLVDDGATAAQLSAMLRVHGMSVTRNVVMPNIDAIRQQFHDGENVRALDLILAGAGTMTATSASAAAAIDAEHARWMAGTFGTAPTWPVHPGCLMSDADRRAIAAAEDKRERRAAARLARGGAR